MYSVLEKLNLSKLLARNNWMYLKQSDAFWCAFNSVWCAKTIRSQFTSNDDMEFNVGRFGKPLKHQGFYKQHTSPLNYKLLKDQSKAERVSVCELAALPRLTSTQLKTFLTLTRVNVHEPSIRRTRMYKRKVLQIDNRLVKIMRTRLLEKV